MKTYDPTQMWGELFNGLASSAQLAAVRPKLTGSERVGMLRGNGALHPAIVEDVVRQNDSHEVAALAGRDVPLPWGALVADADDISQVAATALLGRDDVPSEFVICMVSRFPTVCAKAAAVTREHMLAVLAATDLCDDGPELEFLKGAASRYVLSGRDLATHLSPGFCAPAACTWWFAETEERWSEVMDHVHDRLGDDEAAWQVFASLRQEFAGTLDALCDVALGLSGPGDAHVALVDVAAAG